MNSSDSYEHLEIDDKNLLVYIQSIRSSISIYEPEIYPDTCLKLSCMKPSHGLVGVPRLCGTGVKSKSYELRLWILENVLCWYIEHVYQPLCV